MTQVVKVKGIPLELGGMSYVVPPLALGALEQLQDRLAKFNPDAPDFGQISIVVDAAHAALKRNYPEITREQIGELIDVGNMIDVFEAVMDVSGLRRKAVEVLGETRQTGAAQPSTGLLSSPTSAPAPDGPGITSAST